MTVDDKAKDETVAIHAGRMSEAHFGAVNTPVYRASTILYPDLASLEASKGPYTYGRRGTPTHRSLEEALTALEGGKRTLLCPSGLNAIALAILSVCSAGDHLLMVDSCYEPTRKLCDRTLK
ncbi:MAG TPA: PLP-dependent transferase, partial [Rhizomicrobium sp.]|nr:PLP-dependent transferase [Rhizomicrobium sp.]